MATIDTSSGTTDGTSRNTNNVITGTDGDDRIIAGPAETVTVTEVKKNGTEQTFTVSDNDIIAGGGGNDTMTGGYGNDKFVFNFNFQAQVAMTREVTTTETFTNTREVWELVDVMRMLGEFNESSLNAKGSNFHGQYTAWQNHMAELALATYGLEADTNGDGIVDRFDLAFNDHMDTYTSIASGKKAATSEVAYKDQIGFWTEEWQMRLEEFQDTRTTTTTETYYQDVFSGNDGKDTVTDFGNGGDKLVLNGVTQDIFNTYFSVAQADMNNDGKTDMVISAGDWSVTLLGVSSDAADLKAHVWNNLVDHPVA